MNEKQTEFHATLQQCTARLNLKLYELSGKHILKIDGI